MWLTIDWASYQHGQNSSHRLCPPLLVGCSQEQIYPIFTEIWPIVSTATQMWMEGNTDWHSQVFICASCSMFVCLVFPLFVCVFSEAALLRSPGFRRKQTTWIVSSRKHCDRVCLLTRRMTGPSGWTNKKIGLRLHTYGPTQTTQASKGGNRSQ